MKYPNTTKPKYLLTHIIFLAVLLFVTCFAAGCSQPIEPLKSKDPVYKVEHWQQNIEDDEYTKVETEEKTGKENGTTQAKAKNYEGFTAKSFTQVRIKKDGSTLVKIRYDRKEITLTLDLQGGAGISVMQNGAGNKKLLKGKYGAKVDLKGLKKGALIIEKWTPELPQTFPSESPSGFYSASWTDKYTVTIKGDERIKEGGSSIKIPPSKTWADIKESVNKEAIKSLKTEWQGGDYGVYEWRFDNETGEKLTDTEPIDRHMVLYAVTNYTKFNVEDNKIKIKSDKGYAGEKPRGKIIIPEGITRIEAPPAWNTGSFYNCTEITSVAFPSSLTAIGVQAFYGCTGLTNLNLSECTDLTSIGEAAFAYCTGLTHIALPSSLTAIGVEVFSGCTGVTKLNLSECMALTAIEKTAFAYCTGLTNVILPSTLTAIGMEAFFGCTGLTDVNLSECKKLTEIGTVAFYGCTGLTKISLPASLVTIGEGAFWDCTGLTNVALPANLTAIGAGTFVGCTGLVNLTVDPANTRYKSDRNIVYTKDGKTLVCAAGGLTSVNVLKTVTALGRFAFSGCTGLTNINLSGCTKLTAIGERSFLGCTGLTNISLPASLVTIGEGAFSGCTKLKTAVFADKKGWTVRNEKEYKKESLRLTEEYLENASTAADYLTKRIGDDGYADMYWKKN